MFRTEGLASVIATKPAQHVAISALDRRPATYEDIRHLTEQTRVSLRSAGIRRTDRVAIVLPNGPTMASCFLAVASSAASAPLNPAYTGDELDFYLADLRARAIVLLRNTESPAREVAKRRGISILELDIDAD
ncbi:MAG TPA: AMP-binding protein, partial [Labilithrix sp.]|nr:AMP-binding protein [Labilithrix sp.]